MKKLTLTLAVTALSTTLLMPNMALANDFTAEQIMQMSQHPTPEARDTAIKSVLREKGVSEDQIEDKVKELRDQFGLTEDYEPADGFKDPAKELADKTHDPSKYPNSKSQTYKDTRLKMFTRADWNVIKKHPTAEARKTAVQVLQQERGITNPSISAAELLGVFLSEEKRIAVLEEKAKKEAEEKAKKQAEKLAQNKSKSGQKQDDSKAKKLDRQAEDKALKSGWKKS